MALLSKLKTVLGIGSDDARSAGSSVPVEHEVATESERAVKESMEEFHAESDAASADDADPVDAISGIGPAYRERLEAAGVETLADLAAADAASLAEATDIGEGRIAGWIDRARHR